MGTNSVRWRKFCLAPHRTAGFEFSTDPDLDANVKDFVGFSCIPRTTRRWSASMKSPSARPWNAPSRSCITCLFAALNTAIGQVTGT